jgi:hypothetical protein
MRLNTSIPPDIMPLWADQTKAVMPEEAQAWFQHHPLHYI